jgi:porin
MASTCSVAMASVENVTDADDANVVTTASDKPAENGAVPQTPPIPKYMLDWFATAQKYDKYNPQWIISCDWPSTGETLTKNVGGVRDFFARHKMGVGVTSNIMFESALNTSVPRTSSNTLLYVGSKPSYMQFAYAFITYNPGPNTQLFLGANDLRSNDVSWEGRDQVRLQDLALSQKLFHQKMLIAAGYLDDSFIFQGMYTGGNFASGAMGVNSIIPYEIGEGHTLAPTAQIYVKYQWNSGFYNIADVGRSTVMDQTNSDNHRDRAGFRFFPKGDKELFIDEIGYQQKAAPGKLYTWFRMDGWYNATKATDLSSLAKVYAGAKERGGAMSVTYDHQFIQLDKFLPFRGIYGNATVQWATPATNLYQQYYQVILYSLGLFKKRPIDIWGVNLNSTQFCRDCVTTAAALNGYTTTYDSELEISSTYGFTIKPGAILTANVGYIKHPQYGYFKPLKNPVNATVAYTMYF